MASCDHGKVDIILIEWYFHSDVHQRVSLGYLPQDHLLSRSSVMHSPTFRPMCVTVGASAGKAKYFIERDCASVNESAFDVFLHVHDNSSTTEESSQTDGTGLDWSGSIALAGGA